MGLNALKALSITREIQSLALKNSQDGFLNLCGKKNCFDISKDIEFSNEFLPLHENTIKLEAFDSKDNIVESDIYCSIGEGFTKTKAEILAKNTESSGEKLSINI